MSVVIVGGNECMERRYKELCENYQCQANECMERRYKELCENYQCQAKVFTKPRGGLRDKVGSPDLMIFFTDTMSHKMLLGAMSELKGQNTVIEHCRTSSLSALRNVLEKHVMA